MAKGDAAKAADAVFDIITDALKGGDDVRLVGFGRFSVTATAEREGKNPRTGEKLTIPAAKKPKFAAGTELKAAVKS